MDRNKIGEFVLWFIIIMSSVALTISMIKAFGG